MIKSIYETHLQVSNLKEAIAFYQRLGLQLVHQIDQRKCAFFFIGKDKQMLGLWEVAKGQGVQKRHFAFGVDDIEAGMAWLKEKSIEIEEESFGKKTVEPLVHTWMPASCIYFNDPDGNSLELIQLLDDEPVVSNEVLYLSEWRKK
ncbi:VOC family protein [Priestia megaterium]|nr:VOC family protein [Priestia megaterium]